MLEAKSAFQGTFPYLANAPASVGQLMDHGLIPLFILLNFISPEVHSGAGPFEKVTAVTVPEATLGEQHRLKARKRHIRFSGEIGPVELEAESASMEATP